MKLDDKAWEKRAFLGGAIFVVLNVVGGILMGTLPQSGDTDEEVYAWFVDKESGIRTGTLLGAISIIALLLWFGSLWRRMSKAEEGNHRMAVVSLAGLVGGGALFAASASVQSAVAIQIDNLDPADVRFFWVLSAVLLSMSGAFIFAHLFSTSILALRTGFIPKWNALLGFLPAALFLVSTLGAYDDTDLPMITGGIGFITWAIWILAASFNLWKTSD